MNYVTGYTDFSSKPSEQDGNYLALKFSNIPATATSVKVGLVPTYKTGSVVNDDSGLVEIINDPDKNGVFLVHDATQKFVVKTTDGVTTKRDEYSLTGLTLNSF